MQLLQTASELECSPARCAEEILKGVPPVIRFIRSEMRRHRAAELSVPQFRALVFLNTFHPSSLSAVAEHLGLSLSAASRLVDGLVAKRYISRQSSNADRRRVSLNLTPRGQEAHRIARRATEARLAREIDNLTHKQRAMVGATMRLMADVFTVAAPAESEERCG